MRSFFATLRQLVLPAGALPGAPRIVMGPDIPPELAAWGAGKNPVVTFLAVETFYYDATRYDFHAVGRFGTDVSYFEGTYDPNNTVYITKRDLLLGGFGVGSVNLRIGSGSLNTFPLKYEFQSANVTVDAGGSFELLSSTPFVIDGKSAPRGETQASYGTAGTLVTCTGPEIAMPSYGAGGLNSTFTFWNGRLYQIDVTYSLTYTASNTVSIVVLRKGINSTVGQILGQVLAEYNGVNFGYGIGASATFYVKNATAAAISTTLGLTVQRSAGAANIGLYGDVPRPVIVRVHDITDTAPALNGVAVSIV